MGCSLDDAKHTYSQSCRNGNIPFPDPEDFPKCPPGWEIGSANSKVGISCPNQTAYATCQASGFAQSMCLEAGCSFASGGAATGTATSGSGSGTNTGGGTIIITGGGSGSGGTGSGGASSGSGSGTNSGGPTTTGVPLTTIATGVGGGSGSGGNTGTTNGESCVPVPTAPPTTATYPTAEYSGPFEHIGSDGCPEGFILDHNNGSLFFECSVGETCINSMGCNNLGDCTSSTTCYTAEEKCQGEMASGNAPTDVIGSCAYWGCSLRYVFKYSRCFRQERLLKGL